MLVVDPMHCLLEGLAQFHFRNVLKLTTTNAEVEPAPVVAFEYVFPAPTSTRMVNLVDVAKDEAKQISQIQALLVSPLDHTLDASNLLTTRLERKKKKPFNIHYRKPRAFYPSRQPSNQIAICSDIDFMGRFPSFLGSF